MSNDGFDRNDGGYILWAIGRATIEEFYKWGQLEEGSPENVRLTFEELV